ncbi:FAD-dependent oxidoreductase [Priestia endophytica]|jgi:2-polyprenyl-6-methoxyphenol hydroxylase-like FAD-dependent oxidoreductase|uniref:FAD-dependent oxidoreductase n=1 Tax=Priestia endophytica TaxID=135735 RepID=UPI000F5468FB|nr:NAD(P)/FAD-dependent oxidoreductase [Priestia endophytica]MED4074466.1 NAD(P)/FAD-dependent oxidoreductase [Priestia endophytica]RPK01483.1 Salicylate hydroxylase [Priestia endophytica]
MKKLHVLIAGGGIGGLCLAQNLKKAGISFSVYEREDEVSKSGYRLHMNMDGGEALRTSLPKHLYQLYVQTSRKNPRREMAVLIDEQLNEIGVRPHIGGPNEKEFPHTAVNRRTLCQILLSGIEEHVHFNSTITGFEQDEEGVRLFLEDGTIAKGDLLVAADGINSVVRRQLMPEVSPIDTGARAIYSKSPLTKEIRAQLPEILFDGFTSAIDEKGTYMAIGPYEPRRPVDEAAKELAPSSFIEHVDDYIMITLNVSEQLKMTDDELRKANPSLYHRIMLELTQKWHPVLKGLVERINPDTVSILSVRSVEPLDPWETSRVTLIGDAIHAMPPSFGAGSNLALRDASVLAKQIIEIEEGRKGWKEAIARYEEEMRAHDYPIFEMSSNAKTARTFKPTIK